MHPKRTNKKRKILSVKSFFILAVICLPFYPAGEQRAVVADLPAAVDRRPLPDLNGEKAKEYLQKEGLYASLGAAIRAARYAILPARKTPAGIPQDTLTADNRRQAYKTYFAEDGTYLISRSKEKNWRIKMNLASIGYADKLFGVETGRMKVDKDKSRLEVQKFYGQDQRPAGSTKQKSAVKGEDPNIENQKAKATVIEWYKNGPGGLEQGWTIGQKPIAAGGDRENRLKLVLDLGAEGLKPRLATGENAIHFLDKNNEPVLRYDKLRSWDARGNELVSNMGLDRDGRLSITVDDREAVYPLTVDPTFTQVTKIFSDDPALEDLYGWSVAISGDTAIVGVLWDDDNNETNSGSAFIVKRNRGGANNWGIIKKLTASNAGQDSEFGSSVSISGDTAIVGAPLGRNPPFTPGTAHIFERNEGGTNNWGEVKLLEASDSANFDRFGTSVSISGDTAVVGASANDDDGDGSGSAYVFERNKQGADNWGEVKKVTAADAAAGDQFGHSVSISSDTVIVGAFTKLNGGLERGAAYIFERNAGGADMWGEVKKLSASDGADSDRFGASVAIDGDTAAVGALLADVGGTNTGAVYVFERNRGGSSDNWGEVRKLTASNAGDSDFLGSSVAISGDTLIAGAPESDGNNKTRGYAVIFKRNTGGADRWGEVERLEGTGSAGQNFVLLFGHSVAISDDTAIIGAPGDGSQGFTTGSAFVFMTSDNSWGQVAKQTAPSGTIPEPDDEFGRAVAISGDTAIVGEPFDSIPSDEELGAAYIFERNKDGTDSWGLVQGLFGPFQAGTRVGFSVAISGDTAVVGAPFEDTGGPDRGAVYIFERNAGGPDFWNNTRKLTGSGIENSERFGNSVGISGNTIVVGARGRAIFTPTPGSAFIFERNEGGADNWGEVKKLIASDAANGDAFGDTAAISGDTVIVGAPENDDAGSNSGSAYIFKRNRGGADNWGEVKKLVASDAAAGDRFGGAVVISGETAAIGAAPKNSAYIFKRNRGGADQWGEITKINAADSVAGDNFGWSVGLSENFLIVGAPGHNPSVQGGAAYIFYQNAGGAESWGEIKKLSASDPAAGIDFGRSVAISNDTAVVGAPLADEARGAAYIFKASEPETSDSTRFDLDGDGRTDIGVWRPGPGEWWYLRSSDGQASAFQFGQSTDLPVPADFTGDGAADIALFRPDAPPGTDNWFVLRSEDSSFFAFPFGASEDLPAPGDFDGDGRADPAVFRPSTATWFYIRSSDGGSPAVQFGLTGDVPIVEDYDGDGTDDIAVFRPSVSEWYLQRSTAGFIGYAFGSPGSAIPVPADYTGDGRADIAFFNPNAPGGQENWFVLRSEDESFFAFPFGVGTDIPVPGDYDGDGRADPSVFRPSTSTWFLQKTTDGSEAVGFGIQGDVPIPSVYQP